MFIKKHIIFEYECGLLFTNGKLTHELSAGTKWIFPARQTLVRVDLRPTSETVGGQEVMTSDGGTVKASLHLTYRVTSSKQYILAEQPEEMIRAWQKVSVSSVHVLAQVALREWVMARTLADAMENRSELPQSMMHSLVASVAPLGIEVLKVDVLDFSIAGNLRSAYSDLVKAELEGKAALTRARNESAILRNMLNTARLIRENPGLLELRALMSNSKPKLEINISSRSVPVAEESAEV